MNKDIFDFDDLDIRVAEINSLVANWKSILNRINKYSNINICKKGYIYVDEDSKEILLNLEREYNELVGKTVTYLQKFKLDVNVLPKQVEFEINKDHRGRIKHSECASKLNEIIAQGTSVISLLKGIAEAIREKKDTALLSQHNEELISLEKQIDEIMDWSSDNSNDLVYRLSEDLKKSIEHFRKGAYLGAVMIAGRVITIVTDKLKAKYKNQLSSSDKDSKENSEEDLYRDVFGDKEASKLIDSIRKYRNKFAHVAGTNPEVSEALAVISSTIYLLNLAKEKI